MATLRKWYNKIIVALTPDVIDVIDHNNSYNDVFNYFWSQHTVHVISSVHIFKVWDVALETATPLYRAGGGVTLTAWSPDERNLFAATPSSLFRLGHLPD